jgi:hypothetical protein
MAVKRRWLRIRPVRRDLRLWLKTPAADLAPRACPLDTLGHNPSTEIAFRLGVGDLVRERRPFPSVAVAVYYKDLDRVAEQSRVHLGGQRPNGLELGCAAEAGMPPISEGRRRARQAPTKAQPAGSAEGPGGLQGL